MPRGARAATRAKRQVGSDDGARLHGFAPIIDEQVERLILGSFPSAVSLAAGQYYAHPRNQFWPILARLLDEPLEALPYDERLPRVLAHRLGIWDVYGACERTGSADTAIRQGRPNAFARLRRLAPRLRAIAFNGLAAARFRPLFEEAGFAVRVLPSTSPAHAGRSFEEKLALWGAWWRAPDGV
ncbi:MAG TPA: DNA-deoxyinosine glycosylase [Burkholderiaceae bacterium]|nr:DNA-deoxyinosine glycosylase [Burkholderiaceae bacterium]HQR69530.1 DNA-deoxyinosine glycosylase [Burkholderiaceae bacterium]